MRVSICIPVYNEEKNIGRLLDSIMKQELKNVSINEIIIVSSGSSDDTDDMVKNYQNIDKRVFLLRQKEREGKASAINLFLEDINNGRCSDSNLIIVSSGDVIFEKNTVENLCNKFSDNDIGLTSANPIPINGTKESLTRYLGHMHWKLHNKFGRHGETIAFRRSLVSRLSITTAVDEGWIEAIINNKGYQMTHVDNANIFNKCPETISDFIKQRRRIYSGHLDLEKRVNYKVSSSVLSTETVKILLGECINNVPKFHYFLGYIMLEMYGRLLGSYDFYIKNKNHYIWEIAETTKDLK